MALAPTGAGAPVVVLLLARWYSEGGEEPEILTNQEIRCDR